MAYSSGSANNMDGLRTAILSLCVAMGWTLHRGGNILFKNGAFFSLIANTTSSPQSLAIRGGTGIDGNNVLTGQAPGYAAIRRVGYPASDPVFPLTYEIHVLSHPDEVYVVINYNVASYQYLAFGKSNVQGLPESATGAWFSASAATQTYYATGVRMHINDPATMFYQCPGLFWLERGFQMPSEPEPLNNTYGNSFIHAALEGREWSGGYYDINTASSAPAVRSLLRLLPNTWNDETVLLPYPIYQHSVEKTKTILVADLAHIRHLRIDNHTPGDIITLGADKWKIYPWMKKVITARDGATGDASGVEGTGTLGYAVRYTGP